MAFFCPEIEIELFNKGVGKLFQSYILHMMAGLQELTDMIIDHHIVAVGFFRSVDPDFLGIFLVMFDKKG